MSLKRKHKTAYQMGFNLGRRFHWPASCGHLSGATNLEQALCWWKQQLYDGDAEQITEKETRFFVNGYGDGKDAALGVAMEG